MITCERCIDRLDAADSYADPDSGTPIGNRAKDQMGHALYFTQAGRTALCICEPLTPDAANRRREDAEQYGLER